MEATMTGRREAGTPTRLALLFPITLSVMAIVLLVPLLPQLKADYVDVPGAAYLVPMILTVPTLSGALSPVAGILAYATLAAALIVLAVGIARRTSRPGA